MKIVKEGNISSSTRRFTCKHCGCIFECDFGEYRRISDRCNDTYFVTFCPTCKREVYIEEQ